MRKRNASKENGSSKTSSNGAALANGVGTSGHRSNGTAAESIPPKESTSIENGHLETVDKCAKVTKTSSAKSESPSWLFQWLAVPMVEVEVLGLPKDTLIFFLWPGAMLSLRAFRACRVSLLRRIQGSHRAT